MTNPPLRPGDRLNRLIQAGLFKLALEQCQQFKENGFFTPEEFRDFRKDIRAEAAKTKADLISRLETHLKLPEDQVSLPEWTDEAGELLAQLRQSITFPGDSSLTTYETRVQERRQYLQNDAEFREVQMLVEDQWQQAAAVVAHDKQADASTISTFYESAYEIARAAWAKNPGNMRLKALAERAEARRDHLKSENENMTSWAVASDFVRTLNHLNATDPDDTNMVYDIRLDKIGRMYKEEALAETIKQSKILIAEIARRYIDQAQKYLREYRPREAQSGLARYARLNDLEIYLGNELFSADLQHDIQKTQNDISDALQKLQTVEDLAQQAVRDAAEGWFAAALGKFQDALQLYEGAVHSPGVKAAWDEIRNTITRHIRQTEQMVASLFDQGAYASTEQEAGVVLNLYDKEIERLTRTREQRTKNENPSSPTLPDMYPMMISDLSNALSGLRELHDRAEQMTAVQKQKSDRLKIFVSYRRKTWGFTHRLVEHLNKLIDAEIFVDVTGIDEPDFENSILRNLEQSHIVIVIVTEHTFAPDRIHHEDDWVRREIACALDQHKLIVLACENGLRPPAPDDLPENIRGITRIQYIEFYPRPRLFEAGVEELADFIKKISPVEVKSPHADKPISPDNQANLDHAI